MFGGALRHALELGREALDIVQFDTAGLPYPRPLSPDDTAFQHFALVVSDMDLALAQLQGAPGWTPISSGGPQRLPLESRAVTAFKFQDPDGHPLELLRFPSKPFRRIGRSARRAAFFWASIIRPSACATPRSVRPSTNP